MTKKTYVFFSHFISEILLMADYQRVSDLSIDTSDWQENKKQIRIFEIQRF